MKMKDVIDSATANVTDESCANLKIQAGKVIFEAAAPLVSKHILKLSLLQRITMGKAKKEALVVAAMYAGIHLLRTKHDNYALQALSQYINLRAQDSALGSLMTLVNSDKG